MQSPATPTRCYERVPPSAPQRPSRPSPSLLVDRPPRIAPWYEASRQLQVITGLKGRTTDEKDCTLPPLRSLGLDDPFGGYASQPPSLAGRLGLSAEHVRSHAYHCQDSDSKSIGSSSASETDASSVYPDTDCQMDALHALAASAKFFQPPTHAPAVSVASSTSPSNKPQDLLPPTDEIDGHSGRFLPSLANLRLDDEGLSPHYRHRRAPSSPAALQPNFVQSTQPLPLINSIEMVRSRSNSVATRLPALPGPHSQGDAVNWRRRNAYVLVPVVAYISERHTCHGGAARNERHQRHGSPLQQGQPAYLQARATHSHQHHPYATHACSASPLQRSVSPGQAQSYTAVPVAKRHFA